ncbi:Immunity protein Imm1 [Micromonospora viridifaciens]|uniref:Immunity protein Imm1 n=1 Tax=Micromonospora viridifaciens TaxID=1881 RepID=A0A1C4YV96_MICVI|nr:Imm1 family immunity protein [Micromonospora viridifaciens]SCF24557.1 Immunity protein Imm1 [Micromonospora viridifaciens]
MQAWIDNIATPVADVAELNAILDPEPPKGVTLASDDGRRTLHINFYGGRSGLFWETETDLLLAWGPVPPGAPADQVVGDAEYAYDNPWFALPDGAEPFEVTPAQARQAAHEFLRTGGRPTNVQWVVKP